MKLRLESSLPAASLKEKFERDGWRVDQAKDGSMLASHGEIVSEPVARLHLQQMGLLTSAKLRIEFLVSSSHRKMNAPRAREDAVAST
jgi:hypothetical protein